MTIPISYPDTSLDLGLSIPQRPSGMMGGKEFCRSILKLSATQERDDKIIEQILAGNMPDFMRQFKSIQILQGEDSLTYWACPDYLSVGNNEDFVRVSLNALSARRIADIFGCSLMTSKISDQVFLNSDLKLTPAPLPWNSSMITTQAFLDHNELIERKIDKRAYGIIDGIKKDIIFHSSLLSHRSNVCIYGWRYPGGKIIQPANSSSHNDVYQDYSQGIRFVTRKMILNQVAIDSYALLNHPDYHHLINTEVHGYDASTIYL